MLCRLTTCVAAMFLSLAAQAGIVLDEAPGKPGEWGHRPAEGALSQVTPPSFVWRPQNRKTVATYEVQCARDAAFSKELYHAKGITYSAHCPPGVFSAGEWHWRFRSLSASGEASPWSKARAFSIAESATQMPLPRRKELLDRIPKAHPRLFLRPEQLPELRKRAKSDLNPAYKRLVKDCERLLKTPPPTEEPSKYPKGMKRGSDERRKIWWGNRTYTSHALNGAATLAFTHLLDGNAAYADLAKRLLMDCAEWAPKGATGYRYNDEAGMPYNYYFSRAYTFLHDQLSKEERVVCRKVMKIRGKEMYHHLCPRHLWRPYASHSNRAWHFLGEVGIAFLDEIPEAGEWAWFAANVFANVYPAWCDEDGGWHEGMAYWNSYINRFTWWADVMQAAMDVNAFDKPYFSKIGYYPMYMQPPGTQGGGFGDLTARRKSRSNLSLTAIVAAQARNPYWQWYVEEHGGTGSGSGYVGFLRGALPKVEAKPPLDLPSSRLFRGTGQAVLNTTLTDATDNVEIILKSSPFGTQSHGYESQNSFLLYAYGERLFIRTGRRDSYGSKHHKEWMWQTKSTNCITVNGKGQQGHSASAVGRITEFVTGPVFDYVVGDAAKAYKGHLTRFDRRILFVKPDVVVLFDSLEAPEASRFEWLLHAPVKMAVNGQYDVQVATGKAACQASFLWPKDLTLTQTDQFDTPPRPRIKLVEYHLTAKTAGTSKRQDFVTFLRPHRSNTTLPGQPTLTGAQNGFALSVPMARGTLELLLRTTDEGAVDAPGLRATGPIAGIVKAADGSVLERIVIGDGTLSVE